jgi:hypothetical protein
VGPVMDLLPAAAQPAFSGGCETAGKWYAGIVDRCVGNSSLAYMADEGTQAFADAED